MLHEGYFTGDPQFSVTPQVPSRAPLGSNRRNDLGLYTWHEALGGPRLGDELYAILKKRDPELLTRTSFPLERTFNQVMEGALTTLTPESPVRQAVTDMYRNIVTWIEGWVDPLQRPPDTNPDKPQYAQVYAKAEQTGLADYVRRIDERRILYELAEDPESIESLDEISQPSFTMTPYYSKWWHNLRFVRFMLARSGLAHLVVADAFGSHGSRLVSDVMNRVPAEQVTTAQAAQEVLVASQGLDIDWNIFPQPVVKEVFDEFENRNILKKIAHSYGGSDLPLPDRTRPGVLAHFELGDVPITAQDVLLPQGFRLISDKVRCVYERGSVPAKPELEVMEVNFEVTVYHEATGKYFSFPILASQFFPTPDDSATIRTDSRLGPSNPLLRERAAMMHFMHHKKGQILPGVDPRNHNEPFFAIGSNTIEALLLQDRIVGDYVDAMIKGEVPVDDGLVMVTASRLLRISLFDWPIIHQKYGTYPISPDIIYTMHELLQKVDIGNLNPRQRIDIERNIRQSLGLGFWETLFFLEETGLIAHFPRLEAYVKGKEQFMEDAVDLEVPRAAVREAQRMQKNKKSSKAIQDKIFSIWQGNMQSLHTVFDAELGSDYELFLQATTMV